MGLTLRATYTICAASAGDYVPVQYSSAAFALMAVGAGLGSTVSPALGGAVADSVGMNWSFASALGGSAVGMAGSVWLLSVRRGFQERSAELSYLDRDRGT
jgi:predicted MFS family arabinose efflux permease